MPCPAVDGRGLDANQHFVVGDSGARNVVEVENVGFAVPILYDGGHQFLRHASLRSSNAYTVSIALTV